MKYGLFAAIAFVGMALTGGAASAGVASSGLTKPNIAAASSVEHIGWRCYRRCRWHGHSVWQCKHRCW
jgi:hypothetical protein